MPRLTADARGLAIPAIIKSASSYAASRNMAASSNLQKCFVNPTLASAEKGRAILGDIAAELISSLRAEFSEVFRRIAMDKHRR